MITWAAAAAAFTPAGYGDAVYLEDTGREAEAAAWFLAHRDEGPGARNLIGYLRQLGRLPDQRSAALPTQVEGWLAARPDLAEAGVLRAWAAWLAALPPGVRVSEPREGGAWCGRAAEALAVRPETGEARYQALWFEVRVAGACGGDRPAVELLLGDLARSGAAGPIRRAQYATRAGALGEEDLAAIDATVATDPWRLDQLGSVFREPPPGESLPDGVDAARARVVAAAEDLSADPRPAVLAAVARVWRRAGAPDRARAAWERVAAADPDNEEARRALRPPEAPQGEEGPAAHEILEPRARLDALLAEGRPADGWDRAVWESAVFDAARAVGDGDLALTTARSLARHASGALRLAEVAVDLHRALGPAERSLDDAIAAEAWPRTLPPPTAPAPDRSDWAAALDARARVRDARGRPAGALDDARLAVTLAGWTPERAVRVGADPDLPARSRAELLGWALARLPGDAPEAGGARAALERALAELPGWVPDPDTWIASLRAVPPPASAPDPVDARLAERLAELSFTVGGEARTLADFPGPVVLDLWATWCGPCKGSLPHLDQLARTHAGAVTVVALSVDATPAKAERYLSDRGGNTFVAAFAGPETTARLGIDGIPAMIVLDAEHHVVARLSGWGPGDTRLDEAVDRVRAR